MESNKPHADNPQITLMAVALILMLCTFSNLYWGLLYYNGDTFLLPCVYQDLVVEGGHWFFWTFSQPKFFFPDMSLYFGLKQLFPGDYIWPYLIQACIHTLALGLFIAWFFRRIFNIPRRHVLFLSALMLSLVSDPLLNFNRFIQGLLWPNFHAGGFLMAMIATVLFWERRRIKISNWAQCAVAALGGFSDPLFVLVFAAPAVLLCLWERTWSEKLLGVGLITGATLGMVAAQISTPYSYNSFGFAQLSTPGGVVASFILFLRETSGYVLSKPLPLVSLIVAVIACVIGRKYWEPHRKTILFFVAAAAMPICAACLTSQFGWRYFSMFFLYCLLAGTGVIYTTKASNIWGMTMVSASIFCGLCGWMGFIYNGHFEEHVEVADYHKLDGEKVLSCGLPAWSALEYPDEVKKLDVLKTKYHLADGLAVDWLCRPVNILSRNQLRLHQINGKGETRLLLNTIQEYGVPGISAVPGKHNFILTYMLDERALIEHFGPPTRVYEMNFSGNLRAGLWVYPPGVLDRALEHDQNLAAIMIGRLQHSAYLLSPAARRVIEE